MYPTRNSNAASAKAGIDTDDEIDLPGKVRGWTRNHRPAELEFETPIRDPKEVQQVQRLKDCKRVLRSEENSVRYLPQRPTLPRKPSPLATLRHYYRCWLSRRSTCVSSAAVASRARRYLCDRRDRRGWFARRDRGPDGLVTPTQGVGLAGPTRTAPRRVRSLAAH